ncbi:MAG: hypothetical protein QW279_11385, partial [Candidatus Jordarchaeaceae archaeon]
MKEVKFVNKVIASIKNVLPETYTVPPKANLFYQITVDNNLKILEDPRNPKRGQSAFQTDLCIFQKKGSILLPKVVIEFKDNISTHDVITYSSKAKKH